MHSGRHSRTAQGSFKARSVAGEKQAEPSDKSSFNHARQEKVRKESSKPSRFRIHPIGCRRILISSVFSVSSALLVVGIEDFVFCHVFECHLVLFNDLNSNFGMPKSLKKMYIG